MNRAFLQQLSSRLSQWLNATPIQKRLHYLTLLNVTGLVLLLSLGLLSSVIKDGYFQSLEQLSTQQRQIQHFNAETARLQVSIQNNRSTRSPLNCFRSSPQQSNTQMITVPICMPCTNP